MSRGRLLVEGSPAEVTGRLEGRNLEVAGQSLRRLARLVRGEAGVEAVQLFGDRLHLRVAPGAADPVMQRLTSVAVAEDIPVDHVRLVSPELEDAFIELLESEPLALA
jgi:ABC-2 type transport system ATP-binding protein